MCLVQECCCFGVRTGTLIIAYLTMDNYRLVWIGLMFSTMNIIISIMSTLLSTSADDFLISVLATVIDIFCLTIVYSYSVQLKEINKETPKMPI